MSAGKLAAQVSHCAEAYWTRWISKNADCNGYVDAFIPEDVLNEYVNGPFTKTICEAKNKNHLLKIKEKISETDMVEGIDYGFIYDKCLTELEPEEEDGTTLTGIWFKPLPDDTSKWLSKKYQLYKQ